MIYLKSNSELRVMKQAGKIAADSLAYVVDNIKPGITTKKLDRLAEDFIKSRGAKPAFKGYRDYPASICTSLNDQVVHGIPSEKVVIKSEDVVSIDLGIHYKNYYGDIAWTVVMKDAPEIAFKLAETGKKALFNGIKKVKPGNRLLDVSSEIQNTAESKGFQVVRQFVGHGIGKSLHEEPQVPNFGEPGKGVLLKPGMVFAIEPMLNEGVYQVYVEDDKWTVKTKDGKLSVHFEHTVAVTNNGHRILTANKVFL